MYPTITTKACPRVLLKDVIPQQPALECSPITNFEDRLNRVGMDSRFHGTPL